MEQYDLTFDWNQATDNQLDLFADWSRRHPEYFQPTNNRNATEILYEGSADIIRMYAGFSKMPPEVRARMDRVEKEAAVIDQYVAARVDDLLRLKEHLQLQRMHARTGLAPDPEPNLEDRPGLEESLKNPRVAHRLLAIERQRAVAAEQARQLKERAGRVVSALPAVEQQAAVDPQFREDALVQLRAMVARMEQQS